MTETKDVFKTFCKISRAFGTAATREELLDLVVSAAVEALDGKAACLFLTHGREDVFVPVAQRGLSDGYLHANPLQARKIVAAMEREGHLHFRDATADPRLEHHEVKRAEGIASILAVPVRAKGKIIGVLSLYTAKKRDFSEDEIGFAAALADQGGIAIDNARLLERARQSAKLFFDMAAGINSSLEIKEVLHNLTAGVAEALGMKGAAIRLLDRDRETLKLVASHGLSDEFLNKGPVPAKRCLAHAMEGRTEVIEDVTQSDYIHYKEETLREGIASMVCTVIRAREEVIGVLRLYSAVKRGFSEDTLWMINALAHQGGLAIQNANLYAELAADKKGLEDDIWSHRAWF